MCWEKCWLVRLVEQVWMLTITLGERYLRLSLVSEDVWYFELF